MSEKFVQDFREFAEAHGFVSGPSQGTGRPADFRRDFTKFARSHGFITQPTPARTLRTLSRSPDIVIDVGVNFGTPWLYSTFPDTPFILVDPQRRGESMLKWKPKHFTYVNKALSDKPGIQQFHEEGAKSSLMERAELTRGNVSKVYDVEVTTVDELIKQHGVKGKIGLKLDAEGSELNILHGLTKNFDKLDFILTEASVLKRFENAVSFEELVQFISARGFSFYVICGEKYNPEDLDPKAKAPRHFDCLFLPTGDPAFERL